MLIVKTEKNILINDPIEATSFGSTVEFSKFTPLRFNETYYFILSQQIDNPLHSCSYGRVINSNGKKAGYFKIAEPLNISFNPELDLEKGYNDMYGSTDLEVLNTNRLCFAFFYCLETPYPQHIHEFRKSDTIKNFISSVLYLIKDLNITISDNFI